MPGSHAGWILLMWVAALPAWAHLLGGDVGHLGRDYGMLFIDLLEQQRRALLDGALLLWDPSQISGTAFWPLPNQAPLYPPLMLAVLARGAVAGLNLCLFLHVLWGMLGTYRLVERLSGHRFAASIAGMLYAYAWGTRFLAAVLPLEGLASAWIPWALYALVRAVEGPARLRWTAVAAVCYAGVPWLGGFIQFLPGLLVTGCVVMVASWRAPLVPHLLRAAGLLALFAALMALVASGKLVPMSHWVPLTDRAGGITREYALGGSLTWSEVGLWLLREGPTTLALALAGVLLAGRRSPWVRAFAAAVAVLVLCVSGWLYGILYDWVPGFDHVREPRRVWLVMAAVLPTAGGLGVAALAGRLALRGTAARLGGALLVLALAVDLGLYAGYRPTREDSLSARLQANALLQDLALRDASEPRFRVVDLAKVRVKTKQCADVLRSSLGLESMEGVLGNVAIQAYDYDYLNVAREDPARLLGLMNGRYVISSEKVSLMGLALEKAFQRDPQRMHEGMDGPYLYRNMLALPRALLAGNAVLDVGGTAYRRAFVLRGKSWRTSTTVRVAVTEGEWDAMDPLTRSSFEAITWLGDDKRAPVLPPPAAPADGAPRRPLHFGFGGASGTMEDSLAFMPSLMRPHVPLPDPGRCWNACTLDLPPGAGGRWLYLAETYALYPGWTARVDGRPVTLYRANGPGTALLLPPSARRVELSYRPPGLTAGLSLTGLGLLLCGVLALRRGASAAA